MQETNDERRERINLNNEIQISELILLNKNNELIKENNRNKELKNNLNKFKQKDEEIINLKKQIENLYIINEQIKRENNNKKKKFNQLLNQYNAGKPIPTNPESENNEKKEFDDYKIEEL